MANDLTRLTLLRAAVGLHSPIKTVPFGVDVQWFAPGIAPGIKDLLFMSVDIEAKQDKSREKTELEYIFHCGISVLDNKVLCDYARSVSLANRDSTLSKTTPPSLDTYHISVGGDADSVNKRYQYLDKRLLCEYNTEHHSTTASAASHINQILDNRPFVLITHGGMH